MLVLHNRPAWPRRRREPSKLLETPAAGFDIIFIASGITDKDEVIFFWYIRFSCPTFRLRQRQRALFPLPFCLTATSRSLGQHPWQQSSPPRPHLLHHLLLRRSKYLESVSNPPRRWHHHVSSRKWTNHRTPQSRKSNEHHTSAPHKPTKQAQVLVSSPQQQREVSQLKTLTACLRNFIGHSS